MERREKSKLRGTERNEIKDVGKEVKQKREEGKKGNG